MQNDDLQQAFDKINCAHRLAVLLKLTHGLTVRARAESFYASSDLERVSIYKGVNELIHVISGLTMTLANNVNYDCSTFLRTLEEKAAHYDCANILSDAFEQTISWSESTRDNQTN